MATERPPFAQLSNLLCCPAERLPLVAADAQLLDRLQSAMCTGELRTVSGRTISVSFEGALIRSDGKIAYLVIDRIARLVAEEGISLADLKSTVLNDIGNS